MEPLKESPLRVPRVLRVNLMDKNYNAEYAGDAEAEDPRAAFSEVS
jgi:hypothetical protein